MKGWEIAEHVVTHAHGDHVGASAWLCRHTGASLAMSSVEADAFEQGSIANHASTLARLAIAPLGHRRRNVDRRLQPDDIVAGFEVIVQSGHSPGMLALWREADRTMVVGDGPINVSNNPAEPRWLHLPDGLHHDPESATTARLELATFCPALVVSTHGFPVTGTEWAAGIHRASLG